MRASDAVSPSPDHNGEGIRFIRSNKTNGSRVVIMKEHKAKQRQVVVPRRSSKVERGDDTLTT